MASWLTGESAVPKGNMRAHEILRGTRKSRSPNIEISHEKECAFTPRAATRSTSSLYKKYCRSTTSADREVRSMICHSRLRRSIPVVLSTTPPGWRLFQSHTVGPFPSFLTAPSTWYAAVATPNLNPAGNLRVGRMSFGAGA